MSENLSKYDIRNVKELTDSSKWEDFERSSRPWILAGDLDEGAPDVVANDEDSEKALKSWERKQLLSCSQLSTRLTKVGAEYVKDVVTITKFMAKLKEKYEEKQEGTFGESYSNFTSLSLSECKGVSDYNNKFDLYLTDLQKYPEVVICRPLVVKQYLEGLGPAFSSWLSSFNLQHSILKDGNAEGVTLIAAQTAARVEEQKINSEQTTIAMMANRKRKYDGNNRQNHTTGGCTIHPHGRHSSDDCVTLHPEKEAEWRKQNPRAAVHRDRNLKRQKFKKDDEKEKEQPTTTKHDFGGFAQHTQFESNESNKF